MNPEELRKRMEETERRRREQIDRLYEAAYRGRIDAPPRELWAEIDRRWRQES